MAGNHVADHLIVDALSEERFAFQKEKHCFSAPSDAITSSQRGPVRNTMFARTDTCDPWSAMMNLPKHWSEYSHPRRISISGCFLDFHPLCILGWGSQTTAATPGEFHPAPFPAHAE
jgi:hypothetical protein